MNTLYVALITLVVYSAVSTLAYIVSEQNDEVLTIFGIGVVGLLLVLVVAVGEKVISIFKYRIGKRSIFEEKSTGNKYKCKTRNTDDIIEITSGYKLVKRYAKKDMWIDIPDFSKELIKDSRINCGNCLYRNDCANLLLKCTCDKYGNILQYDKFEER